MAKRRKKPKKVAPRTRRDPQVVLLLEYDITYEPIDDPEQDRLPGVVREQIQRLHEGSQSRPREAIPDLIDLIGRYPDVRVLYNYLAVAYSLTRQDAKAEETIRENLRRHPDYLFARLNYAETCQADCTSSDRWCSTPGGGYDQRRRAA
ncbi:hypothetical protein [Tautonia plasticadhaerens]|uniref:Tetratricopeptide repeat protein n=1 Tax=Tautonia plasticadhaerens TaxID=2527974 RepID=A0A518GWL5_9BACT|nr:hypothetical protein [Tautonia plasticadhaerens]QDV32941.1 hypothetical protein ElP_07830 [Tautonia plasticadhaerens]